ncbi:hypothetical protein SLS62_005613 [Diatrype stigma]|uniref:Uncharacterized protein n=1 Tax=Diatrype stigma TaxID=117547 RepID=A0AAN9UPF8_9PEZI
MGTEGNSDQPGRTLREMGWKPTRKNYFPPPKDLPNYATRPLPPPPSSSSSSIYDSDQGSQVLTQHHLIGGAQDDARSSTNFSGSVDESALKMVRPPGIVTDLPKPQGQEDEIVSPQPRWPEHKVLKINTDDPGVSPILTPPSGTNSHYQFDVSPLSPTGSIHSCDAVVSDIDRSSKEIHPAGIEGRHPSQADSRPNETTLGFRPLVAQTELLHPRVQKINFRYSDPGSPGGGTVDARDSGEPGPDVGDSTSSSSQGRTAEGSAAYPPQPPNEVQHDSYGHGLTGRDSAAEERKVTFTGANVDSFSHHRTGASNQRHAPPPLKLSERPLAENYVKTPFPPGTNSDYSQQSVFEDDDDADKKQKRRSSGISILAEFFRPASTASHRGDGSNSFMQQHEARRAEEPSRASPVPIVRNIISKAKSGLKIGSDESKKDRKRENLKR